MGVQQEDEFATYPLYKKKIYDKENKTVFGRDFASSLKLSVFYLIFYAVLAALFAICMWVFFQTLDPRIPKWRLRKSVIGTNPGMGFRPMPEDVESTLIWLQGKNISGNDKWVSKLNHFLDEYYTPGKGHRGTASVKKCSFSDLPQPHEVCSVDVSLWGECSKDNKFLYHKNTPCIFLKLNKIYGWTPEFITHRSEYPRDMPKQLQEHISSIRDEQKKRTVWISCEGENPADVEYLGPVRYYPEIQGFPGYYYPYANAESYLSPLVAVHFTEPKAGVVINVLCRAWAKNIEYSKAYRMGSVHFELLID